MVKFESPIIVIRELRRQEAAEISQCHTITSGYQKLLETGSVEHYLFWKTINNDRGYVINEVEQGATNQCMKNWAGNEHFKK